MDENKIGLGKPEIKITLDDTVAKLIESKGVEHAYSDVELTEDGFMYKVSFEKPFDNSWLTEDVEEI
jgi:hypothetical protein